MIIFENIYTGETVGIDRLTGGKYYRAKLSAVMNSSNMSPNSDRGQDYGYRLQPEQQALLEQWEADPETVEKVSKHTSVPIDELTHSEFLAYMLYQQEAGTSPEKSNVAKRKADVAGYEARVAALRDATAPETMKKFEAPEAKPAKK